MSERLATVERLTCAKCAGDDISTSYHKPGCSKPDCVCATCSYGSHAKEHGEHLHYFCRTCRWDWVGVTADV